MPPETGPRIFILGIPEVRNCIPCSPFFRDVWEMRGGVDSVMYWEVVVREGPGPCCPPPSRIALSHNKAPPLAKIPKSLTVFEEVCRT